MTDPQKKRVSRITAVKEQSCYIYVDPICYQHIFNKEMCFVKVMSCNTSQTKMWPLHNEVNHRFVIGLHLAKSLCYRPSWKLSAINMIFFFFFAFKWQHHLLQPLQLVLIRCILAVLKRNSFVTHIIHLRWTQGHRSCSLHGTATFRTCLPPGSQQGPSKHSLP